MSRSYLDKEIETHVDTLTERAWLSISQKCLLFHRFFHLVGCILFTVQYPQKLIPLLLHGILTPLPTLFFILQKRKNISLNVPQFLKFLKSRRNKTERIKKKKTVKRKIFRNLETHTHNIKIKPKTKGFYTCKVSKKQCFFVVLPQNGTPLQYSCLENPMDGGACRLQSMGSQRVGHD